jgi:hypothetical protein
MRRATWRSLRDAIYFWTRERRSEIPVRIFPPCVLFLHQRSPFVFCDGEPHGDHFKTRFVIRVPRVAVKFQYESPGRASKLYVDSAAFESCKTVKHLLA